MAELNLSVAYVMRFELQLLSVIQGQNMPLLISYDEMRKKFQQSVTSLLFYQYKSSHDKNILRFLLSGLVIILFLLRYSLSLQAKGVLFFVSS